MFKQHLFENNFDNNLALSGYATVITFNVTVKFQKDPISNQNGWTN